jgi:hypothetical protein
MFKLMQRSFLAGIVAAALSVGSGYGETPAEWVTLGARVHGAFGSFLPVGIQVRSGRPL